MLHYKQIVLKAPVLVAGTNAEKGRLHPDVHIVLATFQSVPSSLTRSKSGYRDPSTAEQFLRMSTFQNPMVLQPSGSQRTCTHQPGCVPPGQHLSFRLLVRDTLAFQWDFRTVHGREKVTEYIGKYEETAQISTIRLRQSGQCAPSVAKPTKHLEWIESTFDFETKTGRGSGMLQIVQGANGIWKRVHDIHCPQGAEGR